MKQLTRFVEILNTIGFALIVGSVIYFIIGNVVSVVHGDMLDWTFCGSAQPYSWRRMVRHRRPYRRSLVRPVRPSPDERHHSVVHDVLGRRLAGASSLLLKVLGHQYRPPGGREE